MPIHCAIPIANLTRDEFIRRDELVMDCAYAAQNKLGRLCDERVYENELADRLRTAGVKDVATQVPLHVTHGPFTKEYRLDLVTDHAVYELKTVTQFTRAHDTQVFNYAMCLGIRCIKLVNFRGNNVDGKLRIMSVTAPERHGAKISTNDWQPLSPRCQLLKQHLTGLVDDLGGFLEASLSTKKPFLAFSPPLKPASPSPAMELSLAPTPHACSQTTSLFTSAVSPKTSTGIARIFNASSPPSH